MAFLVDQLLLPERALRRVVDDVARLVSAAEGVAGALGTAVAALERMEGHLASIDERLDGIVTIERRIAKLDEHLAYLDRVPPEISGLKRAFDRSNDEIEALRERMGPEMAALRHTLEPVVGDLDEVKDVVEPLQPAAERLGRLAERLPGGKH